jgi:hypothetical protein
MEALSTFILNMKKKFLTFCYKKKNIALQDVRMKLDFEAPSLVDFKDISKVILQDNQTSIQRMRKEFDKVVADKDKEISCLKEHRQELLAQIKKSKDNTQCN